MPGARRWWIAGGVVAFVAVVVALVVATRGGEEAATPDTAAPTTTQAPTTTEPPILAPLTGLPIDPAVANRPALIVKIDNAEGLARPQAGINQADVVVEEKVEGNISRFFAVFQSTDAASIGPVRSARTTDIKMVGAYNYPLFAYSGANDTFLALIAKAPLVDVGYSKAESAYQRLPDRRAPHNLFTSSGALWPLAPDGAAAPQAFAEFGRVDGTPAPAGSLPASGIGISFGPGGAPVDYAWDPGVGGWARSQAGTPDVDTDGVQVAPANVIVQYVRYVDSGAVDANHNPVPEAETVGSGQALVALDGFVVPASWQRDATTAMTTYRDSSGAVIALRPGRTWVALVPVGLDVAVR